MGTKEAKEKLTKLVVPHYIRDGCLPEADGEINDASREVVAAMARDHGGECWLGNVNLHKRYRGEPEDVMWKWDGGLVCNFEAAFVVPRHDAELERLILERADAEYTGTRDDAKRIDTIFERIQALGGEHLHWT